MFRKRSLAVILGAPLLFLLVACGGSDNKSASSDTTPTGADQAQATATKASSSTTATSGGGGNASEIADVISNFINVKSFRGQTVKNGQTTTLEYVAPNKLHLTIPGTGEYISIGDDSYLKTGPTWIKAPAGTGLGNFFKISDLSAQIQQAQTSGVTKGGKTTVNGKSCDLWTYKDTAGAPTEMCVADKLPIRVVYGTGADQTTLLFSDFNSNIDIKAPI